MRYLLDTNVFLWWLNDDKQLKSTIKKLIFDPKNIIYVSVVSGLEMSIKHKIGKLPLKTSIKKCFDISQFEVVPLSLEHVLIIDTLPLLHKDPFDRILIAQSMVENFTFITSDEKIWKYKIDLIKA